MRRLPNATQEPMAQRTRPIAQAGGWRNGGALRQAIRFHPQQHPLVQ